MLGGVVAAQGEVSLPLIALAAWVAAALGDLVSYLLGRRLGRRFLVAHGPRVGVTPPRLARVDTFFDRHGGKAILIGRFVGLVRAVAPFVAGASGLSLRRFLPYSLAGTLVWATAFTLAGYAFHESFETAAGRAHPRRARPRGARGGRGRRQDAPRPPLALAQRRTASCVCGFECGSFCVPARTLSDSSITSTPRPPSLVQMWPLYQYDDQVLAPCGS